MQLSSLECFATAKLNCGYADLDMLDNVYSRLAEECCYASIDDIVDRADDLNNILFEVYSQVTSKVQDEIYSLIKYREPINLVVNNDYTTFEITDEQAKKLEELAESLTENEPFCNYLDTYFQNDLDQTVDWENSLESNVEDLIRYWIESDKLQLTEEKQVLARCLNTDGSDNEFEVDYILRGNRLYKYETDLVCELHDEELDKNYLAQKICEDLSSSFVQSIELEDETIYTGEQ